MKKITSATLEIPRALSARRAGEFPHVPLDGGEPDNESTATLDVLLFYEDVSVALRAKEVIERLEAEMEIKPRIIVHSWRLETLDDPILRKMATDDARKASMVFLSLHGHRELFSPVLRDWLETWLKAREIGPGALVVSFDADLQGTIMAESSLAYLHQITASSNVMVFPHFGEMPPTTKGWMFQNGNWPRAAAAPFA